MSRDSRSAVGAVTPGTGAVGEVAVKPRSRRSLAGAGVAVGGGGADVAAGGEVGRGSGASRSRRDTYDTWF